MRLRLGVGTPDAEWRASQLQEAFPTSSKFAVSLSSNKLVALSRRHKLGAPLEKEQLQQLDAAEAPAKEEPIAWETFKAMKSMYLDILDKTRRGVS